MGSTFLKEVEDRLLRYVKIDTTADPTSSTSPSTAIQFDRRSTDLWNGSACRIWLRPRKCVSNWQSCGVRKDSRICFFIAYMTLQPRRTQR